MASSGSVNSEPSYWYRISADGAYLSVHQLAAFFESLWQTLQCGEGAGFVIREPEVQRVSDKWTPECFHDGSLIPAESVAALIRDILDGEGFWCRLESSCACIHIGEEVVYLGLSTPMPSAGPSIQELTVERVKNSPYFIERPDHHPYPPLDVAFWNRVRKSAQTPGLTVVLCQWAGGLGGEKWFHVQSPDDVDIVSEVITPRSILALFPKSSVLSPGENVKAFVEDAIRDVQFGDIRLLKAISAGIVCSSTIVSDEIELREAFRDSKDISAIVVWPEVGADGLVLAACADSDGIVRTSAVFE